MKKFFRNIEVILGSITISITILSVIINVFLRYGFGIQYAWVEEVAVGCFVWTVFLGATASYKNKTLIGVEVVTQALPPKAKRFVELMIYILLFVLNITLFYLSYKYVSGSNKITAVLEVSYVYINSAIVVAFGLMSFYSLKFLVEDLILFMDEQRNIEKK